LCYLGHILRELTWDERIREQKSVGHKKMSKNKKGDSEEQPEMEQGKVQNNEMVEIPQSFTARRVQASDVPLRYDDERGNLNILIYT